MLGSLSAALLSFAVRPQRSHRRQQGTAIATSLATGQPLPDEWDKLSVDDIDAWDNNHGPPTPLLGEHQLHSPTPHWLNAPAKPAIVSILWLWAQTR